MPNITVVGGGQASAQAVEILRREGFDGQIVLVCEEPSLPYQRPPLSKKFLLDELSADRLLLRDQAFYDEHQIDLRVGIRAVSLSPELRQITLSSGETLDYDQLLLCLGATVRKLTTPGAESARVRYLRSVADVERLRPHLQLGTRLVIIGAGYIGLEVAASAHKLGCTVHVLEMSDRVMSRVVAATVSEFFHGVHYAEGVNVLCNVRIVDVQDHREGARIRCSDGSVYDADVILVGIGALPNVQLAENAGLACDNGIVVDEYCRTSHPRIFAAGDCTSQPSLSSETRIRLESVDNAVGQGTAAALNLLGRPTAHDRVPWFWSDQYDHKLLIVGLAHDHDQQVTRGDPATGSFSICYLKRGVLVAVESVNQTKDHMAARKLITQRARPRIERLADPAVPLKDAAEYP